MTKEKFDEFRRITEPVIKWINNNANPHSEIVITYDGAELFLGEASYHTEKFIKD